jgi:hypothetical protein
MNMFLLSKQNMLVYSREHYRTEKTKAVENGEKKRGLFSAAPVLGSLILEVTEFGFFLIIGFQHFEIADDCGGFARSDFFAGRSKSSQVGINVNGEGKRLSDGVRDFEPRTSEGRIP